MHWVHAPLLDEVLEDTGAWQCIVLFDPLKVTRLKVLSLGLLCCGGRSDTKGAVINAIIPAISLCNSR